MIVATYIRNSTEEKLGIGLQQINDKLVISSLNDSGVVVTQTCLKVGYRIRMINNVDCTTKTGKDAIQYLLGDGYVTILADINLINEPDAIMPSIFESNMVTATAIRESPEVKLGIGLRKLDGELIISSLNETGAFSPQKTALRVGYRIVMIDNVNCANVSTEEAVQLLRERSLSSVVTVVALAHGALVPVATALSIHPAPPGRADGGTWGTNNYIGVATGMVCLLGFICCGVPLVCAFCCPCDKQDAYLVNGTLYQADGRLIGKAAETNFAPGKTMMQRS